MFTGSLINRTILTYTENHIYKITEIYTLAWRYLHTQKDQLAIDIHKNMKKEFSHTDVMVEKHSCDIDVICSNSAEKSIAKNKSHLTADKGIRHI